MSSTARSHPAVSAVKQAIDSGRLGETALVRLHHWRPRSEAPLEEQIAADLDVVLWLFGEQPVSVFARGAKSERSDFDYLQVHLGFADRGMALVDAARTLPEGAGYFSLSAIGTEGAVYADDHPNTHLLFRGGPPAAILAEPLRAAATRMTPAREAAQVIASVWQAMLESLAADRAIDLPGGRNDV